MNKPKAMTRQELYDLVWSEPVSKLAKQFNLSDKGLAKKCNRHSIPCPPVGYWAKKQNGQNVNQVPLPNTPNPELETVMFWPKSKPDQSKPENKHHLCEEQLALILEFNIPERVIKYHSSIAACRKDYKQRDKHYSLDKYGRINFTRRVCNPGLNVSPDTLDRACLLFEGIIKLFDSIGWSFKHHRFPRDESGKWEFTHLNETLRIEIKEPAKQLSGYDRPPNRLLDTPNYSYTRYKPTGMLD